MRKIMTIFSFFAVIISGCMQQKENRQVERPMVAIVNDMDTVLSISDFESYILSLGFIPLPLEHHVIYGDFPDISMNYDEQGFQKYNYAGWTNRPLGILYRDDKTIGIVDYTVSDFGLAPFLTTYDFSGNKIDSTSFYGKTGMDIGYEAVESLIFNTDRTIIVFDTVKRWDFTEEGIEIIDGDMKLTTGKTEYRITENGIIEKHECENTSR